MKRGYLLPLGCKDLYDVLKLKQHSPPQLPTVFFDWPEGHEPVKSAQTFDVKGELIISKFTTVAELAAQLSQKPYRIVADLMEIGRFATTSEVLDFETISAIARKYGFIAKRAK